MLLNICYNNKNLWNRNLVDNFGDVLGDILEINVVDNLGKILGTIWGTTILEQ